MRGASANTIVLPPQLSGREFDIVGRFAPQDLLIVKVAATH
jgi:hypothetical protein